MVVDHIHAIRLANTVVDQAQHRVQQATQVTGAASALRWTASTSCFQPPKAAHPEGRGRAGGSRTWVGGGSQPCRQPTAPDRDRAVGPATACAARIAATAGAMAARSCTVPAGPPPCAPGRPRSSPPRHHGGSNGPTEVVDVLITTSPTRPRCWPPAQPTASTAPDPDLAAWQAVQDPTARLRLGLRSASGWYRETHHP